MVEIRGQTMKGTLSQGSGQIVFLAAVVNAVHGPKTMERVSSTMNPVIEKLNNEKLKDKTSSTIFHEKICYSVIAPNPKVWHKRNMTAP
mmetsp:Transcript_9297/g.26074  ORF Transcript_9297/g.26074 Transcript_9297/m.26074 type:complete len:89 (-) Transcript_9297:561-827(-)